ncbi:MAG TPA: flagellar hook-associated protein FlgK, partial [Beijerinckiaceae bacterium]
TDSASSLSGRIAALSNALQGASAKPGDRGLANAAVAAAQSLADALNAASAAVQGARQTADGEIAASVETVNRLLKEFGDVEISLMRERAKGGDVTDLLDRRDAILKTLSEEIGATGVVQADGSTAIYASGGATLFDKTPRTVTFAPTAAFGASTTGAAVYVDGVNITSDASPMPATSGRIAGLIEVRDKAAPQAQAQLDEIARGLVVAFAEPDVGTPAALPDRPGLFTYPGAGAAPGATVIPGLAAAIRINATVDPAQGGDVFRLRDGGASLPGDPSYVANPTGASAYSERLLLYIERLTKPQGFDAAAGLGASASVTEFATGSVSWAAGQKQKTTASAEQAAALTDRLSLALSNATGVNIDDEMAKLLDIEHAFQASAKLLTSVDALYRTLFEAVN